MKQHMLALVHGLLLEYYHIHSNLQRAKTPPMWDELTNSLVKAQNRVKGKLSAVISPPEQLIGESSTKVAMVVGDKKSVMSSMSQTRPCEKGLSQWQ